MRIKKVECEQFAGLVDKDIKFDDGLNIVVGDNEVGKSTIVDLIYNLLFKDSKLDGRSDFGFIDKYFPKNVSGPQGDVIDGTLVFETKDGEYKIKKEWDKLDGSCRLVHPNKTSTKNSVDINNTLKDIMEHRAGVYDEIVFASQKRNQLAIESIMKSLSKKDDDLSITRSNLTSTLRQATLETGGISIEKIEKQIQENLDLLAGRWDFYTDAPEGGPKRASHTNKWSAGAGEIVKAYYEVNRITEEKDVTEENEKLLEEVKTDIRTLKSNRSKTEEKKDFFQKISGTIGQVKLLKKAINDASVSIKEQENILTKWPELRKNINEARMLQQKLSQAITHELFIKAEKAKKNYDNKLSVFNKLAKVEGDDLKALRTLESNKQKEESKLASMNIVAKINKHTDSEISISSISSGSKLQIYNNEVSIKEAVNITVPGVFEMELMPQGVDANEVRKTLDKFNNKINQIYKKYTVNSLEELQELYDEYEPAKSAVSLAENSLISILGDRSFEDIKKDYKDIPKDIESETVIKKQILELCGPKNIDEYIGSLNTELINYENKYKSMDELGKQLENLKKENDENNSKLQSLNKIPEEFKNIDNPDEYLKELQKNIESYDQKLEERNNRLIEIEKSLGDKTSEEYLEELEEKKAIFEAKKAEHKHWINIYEAFKKVKEESAGNPIEDIENKFKEYLSFITNGDLGLRTMNDKLFVELASGQHALTYDILSDGTKDTISLAFRLAMLEHLFPNGEGIAVFDDPFTDMDPKRVEQSCKLIEKFAENNQVIFITCDGKYKNMMNGNIIDLD